MGLFGFGANAGAQGDTRAQQPQAAVAAAGDGAAVMDSSDQHFAKDVLEASTAAIILVDFWAPWCGPCKQLTPLLEAKAHKSNGKIRLVKINIDEHNQIASQLRVQSIPAVFAFFDGRPIDGFMGAVSAKQLDQFVERLIKTVGDRLVDPVEELLRAGEDNLAGGQLAAATEAFSAVLQVDAEQPQALAGLARCWLEGGEAQKASLLLETLPERIRDHDAFTAVRASVEMAQMGGDSADISALRRRVEADPTDISARFELAQAYAGGNRAEEAVELLLGIIGGERDWGDGAARDLLLKIFESWGDVDPRTAKGRRRLAMLLF